MTSDTPLILNIIATTTDLGAVILGMQLTSDRIKAFRKARKLLERLHSEDPSIICMTFFNDGVSVRRWNALGYTMSREDHEKYVKGFVSSEPLFPLDHEDNETNGFSTFTADMSGIRFELAANYGLFEYRTRLTEWGGWVA